ncbi:MAG: TatD family hydrolase [Myxococcaceae bacterium]|nr:TatD family hydrolase [Myxococcaceae bacterium]
MFDAHCHLQLPAFDADRAAVFERSLRAGVDAFCVCSVGPDDWQRTLDLAGRPGVFIGVGIHPIALVDLDERDDQAHLDRLEQLVASHRHHLHALGECGLDARIADRVPLRRQRTFVAAQIAIAAHCRLPIVLHCVRAHDALLDLIAAIPHAWGLLHAFSGSLEQARAFLKRDLFFSFGGALTLPSHKRRTLARGLPGDRILVETDAPDGPRIHPAPSAPANHPETPPAPLSRLEPGDLFRVVEALALLRGEAIDHWARQSDLNARALFQAVPS